MHAWFRLCLKKKIRWTSWNNSEYVIYCRAQKTAEREADQLMSLFTRWWWWWPRCLPWLHSLPSSFFLFLPTPFIEFIFSSSPSSPPPPSPFPSFFLLLINIPCLGVGGRGRVVGGASAGVRRGGGFSFPFLQTGEQSVIHVLRQP